jgi:hypothetical protein
MTKLKTVNFSSSRVRMDFEHWLDFAHGWSYLPAKSLEPLPNGACFSPCHSRNTYFVLRSEIGMGGEMNKPKEAAEPTAGASSWKTIRRYAVVAVLVAGVRLPANAAGRFVAHNTPSYVATAKNLGAENPLNAIEVSIWLNPHNRAELDAMARQLYDPTSPQYRHCLSRAQFAALCNSPASLHTKVSWDNVTGVGTPSAQAFADSFRLAGYYGQDSALKSWDFRTGMGSPVGLLGK